MCALALCVWSDLLLHMQAYSAASQPLRAPHLLAVPHSQSLRACSCVLSHYAHGLLRCSICRHIPPLLSPCAHHISSQCFIRSPFGPAHVCSRTMRMVCFAAPYAGIFRRLSAPTRTARYIRSEYHSASGRKQAGQERHMFLPSLQTTYLLPVRWAICLPALRRQPQPYPGRYRKSGRQKR